MQTSNLNSDYSFFFSSLLSLSAALLPSSFSIFPSFFLSLLCVCGPLCCCPHPAPFSPSPPVRPSFPRGRAVATVGCGVGVGVAMGYLSTPLPLILLRLTPPPQAPPSGSSAERTLPGNTPRGGASVPLGGAGQEVTRRASVVLPIFPRPIGIGNLFRTFFFFSFCTMVSMFSGDVSVPHN